MNIEGSHVEKSFQNALKEGNVPEQQHNNNNNRPSLLQHPLNHKWTDHLLLNKKLDAMLDAG
jgi:hypothetical protein